MLHLYTVLLNKYNKRQRVCGNNHTKYTVCLKAKIDLNSQITYPFLHRTSLSVVTLPHLFVHKRNSLNKKQFKIFMARFFLYKRKGRKMKPATRKIGLAKNKTIDNLNASTAITVLLLLMILIGVSYYVLVASYLEIG